MKCGWVASLARKAGHEDAPLYRSGRPSASSYDNLSAGKFMFFASLLRHPAAGAAPEAVLHAVDCVAAATMPYAPTAGA